MRAPVVNPNRLVLALALNTYDAAPATRSRCANGRCSQGRGRTRVCGSRRSTTRRAAERRGLERGCKGTGTRAWLACRARRARPAGRARRAWPASRTRLCGSTRRTRRRLARYDGDEVVVRDRIFVFLTQEVLFDQHIQIGRRGVRELALKEANCMSVLLPAEYQLLFFLALGHLFPHWHGDCHHDGHDAQGNQQDHHRVALFDVPLVWGGARSGDRAARRSGGGRLVHATEIVSFLGLGLRFGETVVDRVSPWR
jgi:hypothetical protein